MNMSIINKISNIVSYIFNNVFAFSMLFMFLIIISLLIFNINRNNNIIKIFFTVVIYIISINILVNEFFEVEEKFYV